MTGLPKRALTPEQKRAVIERVLTAWVAEPQQRLGQLVANAVRFTSSTGDVAGDHNRRLYYVEDTDLAELLETWRNV